MPVRLMVRAGLVLLLFGWGIIGALHYEVFLPLHAVNLMFHECGHLFFGIFGNDTLTVLGGSLMQLAIPCLVTGYFLMKRELFSGAITFFWVGQNFLDIAVYVKDARALALPLVSIGDGAVGNGHDWNYLLSHWGVLPYDIEIAKGLLTIGWLFFFLSLALGLYMSDLSDGTFATDYEESTAGYAGS